MTHTTRRRKSARSSCLIREYLPCIRHVHLNEMDGRRPGAGNYPVRLAARGRCERLRYNGWLSVEVFDFKPDGETVARLAGEYLKKIGESL